MSEEIKCSKNNPCQSCQEELKQKLAECKDWEVKKREYIKSWFPFHDEEGNKIKYSETGGYNICSCRLEISNSHGDINPNNHNCSNKGNLHRERERESILVYFKSRNIKSITLKNNKLVIKYQDKEEEKEANITELQQIQSYCQKQGINELKLSDLQQTNQEDNNKPPTNYLPYILGGIGIVAVIGIGAYFWTRKNNKE